MCFSHFHHLTFGRIIHFEYALQFGKNSCLIFLIISPLYPVCLLTILISWIFNLLDLSHMSLIFPMFSISFFFKILSSRKQTRWYFPIILLKFCYLIFNSIQYSGTSHVNETKGPVTTPVFFQTAFSTWLLLSWLSLWFAIQCFTFAFGTGNYWTIFCKLRGGISLDPTGTWHPVDFYSIATIRYISCQPVKAWKNPPYYYCFRFL